MSGSNSLIVGNKRVTQCFSTIEMKFVFSALGLLALLSIASSVCPPKPDCSSKQRSIHSTGKCETYYVCDGGKAHTFFCPTGLHYDAQTLMCTSLEVANCEPCSDDLSIKGGGGAGGSGGEGCLGGGGGGGGGSGGGSGGAGGDCYTTSSSEKPTAPPTSTSSTMSTATTPPPTTTTTSTTTTTTPTTTSSPLPPCEVVPTCPVFGTKMMPYPADCTKFIQCVMGFSKIMQCPDGQEFSPAVAECMDPALAGCVSCSGNPTTVPTTTTTLSTTTSITTTTATSTTITPTTVTSTSTSPTTTTATTLTTTTVGVCPNDPVCPSTQTTKLQYPSDCTKYIQCNFGVASINDCQIGYEFSTKYSDCLPAEFAGCPYCVSQTTTPIETTTTPTTTTPTTTTPTTTTPTTTIPSTTVAFCPNDPVCASMQTTKLRFPSDCTKYIQCIFGIATILDCPIGYEFSSPYRDCLPAEFAGCPYCIPQSTTTIETTTTTPTTTTPTTTTPTTTTPTTTTPTTTTPTTTTTTPTTTTPTTTTPTTTTIAVCANAPTCPFLQSNKLPYPSDCSKYIQCVFGRPNVVDCPTAGYQFSTQYSDCLPAEFANCPVCIPQTTTTVSTTTPTTTTPTTNTPTTTTPTTTTPTTTTPTTTTPTTTIQTTLPTSPTTTAPTICPSSPICNFPLDSSKIPIYADCSKYIQCRPNLTPVIVTCSSGSLFSPTVLDCVPVGDADCLNCVTATAPTTTTVKAVDCSTPTCATGQTGKLPLPSDCTQYVQCTDGIAEIIPCAPWGFNFSALEGKCVESNLSNCINCVGK